MTVLLDLEPEREAQIAARAQELGVPVPEYLHELIARSIAEASQDNPGGPAGFLDKTYGILAPDPLTRLPQGDAERREPLS